MTKILQRESVSKSEPANIRADLVCPSCKLMFHLVATKQKQETMGTVSACSCGKSGISALQQVCTDATAFLPELVVREGSG